MLGGGWDGGKLDALLPFPPVTQQVPLVFANPKQRCLSFGVSWKKGQASALVCSHGKTVLSLVRLKRYFSHLPQLHQVQESSGTQTRPESFIIIAHLDSTLVTSHGMERVAHILDECTGTNSNQVPGCVVAAVVKDGRVKISTTDL